LAWQWRSIIAVGAISVIAVGLLHGHCAPVQVCLPFSFTFATTYNRVCHGSFRIAFSSVLRYTVCGYSGFGCMPGANVRMALNTSAIKTPTKLRHQTSHHKFARWTPCRLAVHSIVSIRPWTARNLCFTLAS
jgi:hypothetical protein